MNTGNVQNLTGQQGTFAQGVNLGYLYRKGPDNYVDEIGENGGTIYLRDQSGIGRAIYYQSANYRTVFSAVIFGALQGTQRPSLMARITKYLLTGSGIEENLAVVPSILKIEPNPTRGNGTIYFRISGNVRNLTVFDAFGRTVAGWRLNSEKEMTISWNLLNSNREPLPAGIYFVRMTGTGFTTTKSFVVLR